jgi:putative hydrolase of the HAD superfamily
VSAPRSASITTILFDAGGTLVFPNWQRMADVFLAYGARCEVAALERAEARVRLDLDRPEIVRATGDAARWDRYIHGVARGAGLAHVPEAAVRELKRYHDEHNLWEHVPPDVPAALEELGRRFRLGVVSNSNGTARAKLVRIGLARHFEVIVDSQEEAIEKPDPRIFHVALQRMGVRAEESIYIGDMYHVDVVGARAAGLRAVLLDPRGLHAEKPCPRVASLGELRALGEASGD